MNCASFTLQRLLATVSAIVLALALSACGEPPSRKAQIDYPLEIRSRPEPPAPPEPDPETGLVSDAFPIWSRPLLDHLRNWNPGSSQATQANPFADPFAEPPESQPEGSPGPIQQAFSALGIPFPEGTSASYDPEARVLRVVQTPESMALIRYLVEESLRESADPAPVSFRFEFYEVPALLALRLEQSAAAHADDTPEWEVLQSLLGEDGIRLVNVATVQAVSGQRSKYEDGETYLYPGAFGSEPGDAAGESALYLEERLVGTTIEVEAFASTDGRTIDLNFALEFHIAPPDSVSTDREGDSEGGVPARATLFHAKKVTTQLILSDGGTRLIASWTPTGKPEFGQFGYGETRTLVFLAANIQRR